MLMELVRTQGPNNWVRISQQLEHRSPKQCRERFHQNLKPSLNHEPISVQEGEIIEQLVREMGKRWAEIARRLGNRSDNAVKNWWNGSMNRRKRNPAHLSSKHIGNRLHPIPLTQTTTSYRDYSGLSSCSNGEMRHGAEEDEPQRWLFPCNPNVTSQEAHRIQPFAPGPPGPSFTGIKPFLPGSTDLSSFVTKPDRINGSNTGERALLPALRLPPPTALSTNTDWQSLQSRGVDRPLISPAPSDTSQVTCMRQAPSLVSDTQSTYSISPKTVPSPQAHSTPMVDYTSIPWDHSTFKETSKPVLPHSSQLSSLTFQTGSLPCARIHTPESDKGGSTRDTRMHVANLVQ